jgi:hypothetical protein
MSMSDLEPLSLLTRAANAERHVPHLEMRYNALVELLAMAAGIWVGSLIERWAREDMAWLAADAAFLMASAATFYGARYIFRSDKPKA